MLDPEEIAGEIRRPADSEPLRVFWVTVGGERGEFAEQVAEALKGWPVVCDVLRAGGFRDPNALMRDVLDVVDSVRGKIERIEARARARGGVDLVLVSRRQWALTDASSPLDLPEWFPVSGGMTVVVRVVDLTWSARVSLADKVVSLNDLRRLLFELDVVLVTVLRAGMEGDRRKTRSLWWRVWSDGAGDEEIREELSRVGLALDHVNNSTGYRPSVSKKPSVVGQLWAHTNKTPPDGLRATADVLAKALGEIASRSDGLSLLEVLNRSSEPITDVQVRWAFCLLVTLRSACQLATAGAHADDYPQFPSVLLKSTSLDIRRFLDAAVGVLRGTTSPRK